jgi:hypothetical protein
VGAAKLCLATKSAMGVKLARISCPARNGEMVHFEAWMLTMWSNEELSGGTMLVGCTVKGKLGYVVRRCL